MRERLQSGEFQAVETKLYPSSEGVPNRFTKIIGRIYGAFDARENRFRFDRTIEYKPDRPELSYPNRYAVNPKYSCFYRGDQNVVVMEAAHYPISDPNIDPWDARHLGICTEEQVIPPISLATRREIYQTICEPTDVTEKGGICTITLICGKARNSRRRFTIDRKRDYAVTRLEGFAFLPATAKWEPWSNIEVVWKEHSDVWVPTRVDFFNPRAGVIDPKLKDDKHFIDIEWLAVNRPVKEDKFTYEAFELPKGTRVVSNVARPAPQVQEKVIGEEAPRR